MNEQPIIFFDGICNLCNAAVQFVIKRDPAAVFKFCSLQSPIASQLLSDRDFQSKDFNTFILLQNDKIYKRSDAALKVARQLKGPFKLLYGFIIVPVRVRNWVYDLISKNRYRWFGKREECMIPDPTLATRFIN